MVQHLGVARRPRQSLPDVRLDQSSSTSKADYLVPTFGSADLLRLAAHLGHYGFRLIEFRLSDRKGRAVPAEGVDNLQSQIVEAVRRGSLDEAEDLLLKPQRLTVFGIRVRRPGGGTTTIFANGSIDFSGDNAQELSGALSDWFGNIRRTSDS